MTNTRNVAVALELGSRQRLESFETHVRKSLDCLEQAISRNIDVDD